MPSGEAKKEACFRKPYGIYIFFSSPHLRIFLKYIGFGGVCGLLQRLAGTQGEAGRRDCYQLPADSQTVKAYVRVLKTIFCLLSPLLIPYLHFQNILCWDHSVFNLVLFLSQRK